MEPQEAVACNRHGWLRGQLIIDVVCGRGGMFSMEIGRDARRM